MLKKILLNDYQLQELYTGTEETNRQFLYDLLVDKCQAKLNDKFAIYDERETILFYVKVKEGTLKYLPFEYVIYGHTIKDLEQIGVIHDILDNDISIILIEGNAGTGKTFISLLGSLYAGANVIYTRENVEVGKSLGYLKGDLEEKFNVYIAPLQDNLQEIKRLTKKDFTNKVTAQPINFMRGINIREGNILIIDEGQNCGEVELKTLLTRLCEGAKAIVIGDTKQIDNKEERLSNTFQLLCKKVRELNIKEISYNRLTTNRRSKVVELIEEIL